jgi:hypothetical protein
MTKLLDNHKGKFNSKPFSFFSDETLFPLDKYRKLQETIPSWKDIAGSRVNENNQRFDSGFASSYKKFDLSFEWQEVLKYLVSKEFFLEIIEMFGEQILQEYPCQFKTLDCLKGLRVGIRDIHDYSNYDILLDAQIGGNTPVQYRSSVRKSHLDSARKLYAGFIYFRPEDDNSKGGDFEIYDGENKSNPMITIPYKPNQFILFLNSSHSYHGVSERSRTEFPRLFVNVIGVLKDELF